MDSVQSTQALIAERDALQQNFEDAVQLASDLMDCIDELKDLICQNNQNPDKIPCSLKLAQASANALIMTEKLLLSRRSTNPRVSS